MIWIGGLNVHCLSVGRISLDYFIIGYLFGHVRGWRCGIAKMIILWSRADIFEYLSTPTQYRREMLASKPVKSMQQK